MITISEVALSVLSCDLSSVNTTNVHQTTHNAHNFLHLLAAKRTYCVGRENQNKNDVETILKLLKLGIKIDDLDNQQRTPLELALLHGATDIARVLLKRSTPSVNIKKIYPLLCTHGMLSDLDNVSIGDTDPSLIDTCIRQCLAGLGCRASAAKPDKWIACFRSLIPHWKKSASNVVRSLVEEAWGRLLRSRDHEVSDVKRNEETFAIIMKILKAHQHEMNPAYTGGIDFRIDCALCHQRVNMGPARAWIGGQSLITHSARVKSRKTMNILYECNVGSLPTNASGDGEASTNDPLVNLCSSDDVDAAILLDILSMSRNSTALRHGDALKACCIRKTEISGRDVYRIASGFCFGAHPLTGTRRSRAKNRLRVLEVIFTNLAGIPKFGQQPSPVIVSATKQCVDRLFNVAIKNEHTLIDEELAISLLLSNILLFHSPSIDDGVHYVLSGMECNLSKTSNMILEHFFMIHHVEFVTALHHQMINLADDRRKTVLRHVATNNSMLEGLLEHTDIVRLSTQSTSTIQKFDVLFECAKNGNVLCMKTLFENIDENENENGNSYSEKDVQNALWRCFMPAVSHGKKQMCDWLLSALVERECSAPLFWLQHSHALLVACEQCPHDIIAQEIIEKITSARRSMEEGAEENKSDDSDSDLLWVSRVADLLTVACRRGRCAIARTCVDQFPNMFDSLSCKHRLLLYPTGELNEGGDDDDSKNKIDPCQRSILHWCVMNDMSETLAVLLDTNIFEGPDHLVDVAGYSLLTYARGVGAIQSTSILINRGASSMKRANPVLSLWRHITYTTERPKTNLRDELYVGVRFSLEPDEDDTIHGEVVKLYPGALTDDGVSLYDVKLPNYAEEGKEIVEEKMLTRNDLFKVFDAHFYFCYTVYEHHYEYFEKEIDKVDAASIENTNIQGQSCYTNDYTAEAKRTREEMSARMRSALYRKTKDFLVQWHKGVRPMDFGPVGWLSSSCDQQARNQTQQHVQVHDKINSTSLERFDLRDVDLQTTSLLHQACRSGCIGLVRALLSTCIAVDIGESDETSTTPLMFAVIYEHLDVARALVESGADPTTPCGVKGFKNKLSPLECAEQGGPSAHNMVEILLQNDSTMKKNMEAKMQKGEEELVHELELDDDALSSAEEENSNNSSSGFRTLSPERLPDGPVLTESGSIQERDEIAELMESASSIVFDNIDSESINDEISSMGSPSSLDLSREEENVLEDSFNAAAKDLEESIAKVTSRKAAQVAIVQAAMQVKTAIETATENATARAQKLAMEREVREIEDKLRQKQNQSSQFQEVNEDNTEDKRSTMAAELNGVGNKVGEIHVSSHQNTKVVNIEEQILSSSESSFSSSSEDEDDSKTKKQQNKAGNISKATTVMPNSLLPDIHSVQRNMRRPGAFALSRPKSTPPKSSSTRTSPPATTALVEDAWKHQDVDCGDDAIPMRRPGQGLMKRSMLSRPGSVPPPPLRGRPRPPSSNKQRSSGPRKRKARQLNKNKLTVNTVKQHASSHLVRSPVHDLLKSMSIEGYTASKK